MCRAAYYLYLVRVLTCDVFTLLYAMHCMWYCPKDEVDTSPQFVPFIDFDQEGLVSQWSVLSPESPALGVSHLDDKAFLEAMRDPRTAEVIWRGDTMDQLPPAIPKDVCPTYKLQCVARHVWSFYTNAFTHNHLHVCYIDVGIPEVCCISTRTERL